MSIQVRANRHENIIDIESQAPQRCRAVYAVQTLIFDGLASDPIQGNRRDVPTLPAKGSEAPLAPTIVGAVYDPSVKKGRVILSWKNNPKNEESFQVVRSDGKKFPVRKDQTTFIDTSLPTKGWPWTYQISAINASPASPVASATVSVRPVGGPDITEHLLKIEYALENISGNSKYRKDLIEGFKLLQQEGDWDITPLFLKNASTTHNSGVLPDGSQTVTVGGQVYLDAEVNYWIYGVWTRVVGGDSQFGQAKVIKHGRTTKEGPDGKLQWFKAGYTGSIAAAGPGIDDTAGAQAPPDGEDTGPLNWQVGASPGHFNGSDDKNILHSQPLLP